MLMAVAEKSSGDLNGLYINRTAIFFLKENARLLKGVKTVEPCERI